MNQTVGTADTRTGTVDLSIVVPVYNEMGNLEPLVERVLSTLEAEDTRWELILVDDGSSDGSSDRLDELADGDDRLEVLHFVANRGQSAALEAGFQHSGGRLIGLLDADLQTFPEDLPMLVAELEERQVDAVVGIRAERHDSWWKKFSSKVANGVRNRLTREEIVDTGCPIKVFRREAILAVKMFDGMHRFLPTLVKMEGFTVRQMPVRHTSRVAGVSKYGTLDRAFRGLRDAMAVRWMQDRMLRWKLQ